MTNTPVRNFMLDIEPKDIPGLVSFWTFSEPGDRFVAQQGESYCLRSQSGRLVVTEEPGAAFGGTALQLEEGQWLSIPRAECPKLDFHGEQHFSLVAWIRRGKTASPQCEFVAGQWNESNCARQYGLFLNIVVWQAPNRVFGHLSTVGGPTPGYKYCMDGCMGATEVPWDEWCTVGMSFDGRHGYAWFNGLLDAHPTLNPYSIAGGLRDGGPDGSDFTVGAVDRSGTIGNFFCGGIAGLAVYNRALTPAEMYAVCNAGQ
jgi:hypothetical protein